MRGNPNIISVGDSRARAETPKELWGKRDFENHAAEQLAKAQLRKLEPLPVVPENLMGAFRLYERPRRSTREIDRLLEKHGIRPLREVSRKPWV